MSRVGLDESAFPIRDATYGMEIISIWDDASSDDEQISWTRGMWTDLARFARQGAYSNYLVAEDTERFRDSYDADRYRRLVAVKNRLDPDNLFALNHNVVPDPGIA